VEDTGQGRAANLLLEGKRHQHSLADNLHPLGQTQGSLMLKVVVDKLGGLPA